MQTFGVGHAASAEFASDLSRLVDRARPNGAATVLWQGDLPPALLENLRRIGAMNANWDSYGAPAMSHSVQRQATDIAFQIYRTANALGMRLPEVAAFASSDGRIGLLWRDQNRGTDLEILVGDTTVEAMGSSGDEVYEAQISDDLALDILNVLFKRVISR